MIILRMELVHFSDGSGVTGDYPLDLKNGTDDNSTNGTRTSLMDLE